MSEQLKNHKVVSRSEWIQARQDLLKEEKEFMRMNDKLSALRRELPWVEIDKEYTFDGPDGHVTLADLFEGRSQLIIQHFMFGPDWEEGCVGCSFGADHVDPARVHFQQRDISFAAVSRAPYEKIAAFKKRMGWKFNWVSSYGGDFNYDFHVSFTPAQMGKEVFYNYALEKTDMDELPGMSVFYKDEEGRIYHTYSTYARGLEVTDGAYAFIDLAPKGRDEAHLEQPTAWWRHHDRYEAGAESSCCGSSKKTSDCCD